MLQALRPTWWHVAALAAVLVLPIATVSVVQVPPAQCSDGLSSKRLSAMLDSAALELPQARWPFSPSTVDAPMHVADPNAAPQPAGLATRTWVPALPAFPAPCRAITSEVPLAPLALAWYEPEEDERLGQQGRLVPGMQSAPGPPPAGYTTHVGVVPTAELWLVPLGLYLLASVLAKAQSLYGADWRLAARSLVRVQGSRVTLTALGIVSVLGYAQWEGWWSAGGDGLQGLLLAPLLPVWWINGALIDGSLQALEPWWQALGGDPLRDGHYLRDSPHSADAKALFGHLGFNNGWLAVLVVAAFWYLAVGILLRLLRQLQDRVGTDRPSAATQRGLPAVAAFVGSNAVCLSLLPAASWPPVVAVFLAVQAALAFLIRRHVGGTRRLIVACMAVPAALVWHALVRDWDVHWDSWLVFMAFSLAAPYVGASWGYRTLLRANAQAQNDSL